MFVLRPLRKLGRGTAFAPHRLRRALAIAGAFAIPLIWAPCGEARTVRVSAPSFVRLENGLDVVLDSHSEDASVAVVVAYDAGSRLLGAEWIRLNRRTVRLPEPSMLEAPTGPNAP